MESASEEVTRIEQHERDGASGIVPLLVNKMVQSRTLDRSHCRMLPCW